MSPDVMTVRLHLQRIRVVEVTADLPERLELVVEDSRRVLRCRHCGFRTSVVHDRRRVKVTDLPIGAGPRCCGGCAAGWHVKSVGSGSWRTTPSSSSDG